MARVKIPLPDKFVFATDIPIRIGDMNRGMHLGHETYLVIAEEARSQFLESLGYTAIDINGARLIMIDAAIVYKYQVHYGQTLRVEIAVSEISGRGFEMVYRISDNKIGIESARIKTGFLTFDYKQQKTTPVPQDFRQKFSSKIQETGDG